MTLKVPILQSLTRLFIILVSLRMSLFSDKMLIFNGCISGLMSNLIKKSWTVSTPDALGYIGHTDLGTKSGFKDTKKPNAIYIAVSFSDKTGESPFHKKPRNFRLNRNIFFLSWRSQIVDVLYIVRELRLQT